MSINDKVLQFAKNSILSKKERLARKHGIKDECGDWTETAVKLAVNQLCDDKKEYLYGIAEQMEAEKQK